MQKIIIEDTFAEDWVRMFAHLGNLFFEQCEIITQDETDAMKVEFSLKHSAENKLLGKAILTSEGVGYVAQFSEQKKSGTTK